MQLPVENNTIPIIDNSHPFKKPFILALMIIGIGCTLNIIFSIIYRLIGFDTASTQGEVIASFIVGGLYANKFKEIMPNKLRLCTCLYNLAIGLILSAIYLLKTHEHLSALIAVVIFVNIFESFIIYWSLGWGAKQQIKINEKRKIAQINPKNLLLKKIIVYGLIIISTAFYIGLLHSRTNKNIKSHSNTTKPFVYSNIDDKHYMAYLQNKIKYNWNPPKENRKLHIVTIFKLDKGGNLLSTKIKNSSGIPQADNAAILAIKKSSPF